MLKTNTEFCKNLIIFAINKEKRNRAWAEMVGPKKSKVNPKNQIEFLRKFHCAMKIVQQVQMTIRKEKGDGRQTNYQAFERT